MKTIFITVYDGDVEKNILQSKVFHTLKQAGIRIVLLIKNGIGHNYRRYADENVIVEELPASSCFSEKFLLDRVECSSDAVYLSAAAPVIQATSELAPI